MAMGLGIINKGNDNDLKKTILKNYFPKEKILF